MDIATLIGIILGMGAIIGSIFLMTPDLGMFGSISSFGIVFGGMIASVSLENHIGNIKSFFFRDGAQMVIDGYSLEELTEILFTRIEYRELRENTQAGLFKSMGVMSPAWGMVGTLIGLVVMLSGFGEGGTDTLGAGMSAALITTFYGAVLANLFFLPMSDKIKTRITFTSTIQNLQVEAARLIHQKKHPIIVREKLNSFIPPKEWKKDEG